ncbi:FAD synthetase family protein [Bacillus gobiensis]
MKVHAPGTLQLPASVLTIGALDGVHKGHQSLVRKAKERASELKVPFVIYTFDPPPKVFFKGSSLLTTLEEKLKRLKILGAEHVIVATFDDAFASKDESVFINDLKTVNPIEIWEGPNFLFGKNRKGDLDALRRHFKVKIFDSMQCEEGVIISSSRIRTLLEIGDYTQAERLLGWRMTIAQSPNSNLTR